MTPEIGNLDTSVDITVASPEDYAENTPAPIPQGTYSFRIVDVDRDRDQQGNIRNTKDGFPVINLKSLEVVEGPFAGRKVTFNRVYSTPFQRKANRNGQEVEVTVSGLGDLIRSIDRTFSFASIHDAMDRLIRARDLKEAFKASVKYEAFDKEYYDAQAAIRGIAQGDYTSPEAKQLRKEATLSGRKGFPNGHTAVGPSGRLLEGRVVISSFIPQKEE